MIEQSPPKLLKFRFKDLWIISLVHAEYVVKIIFGTKFLFVMRFSFFLWQFLRLLECKMMKSHILLEAFQNGFIEIPEHTETPEHTNNQ